MALLLFARDGIQRAVAPPAPVERSAGKQSRDQGYGTGGTLVFNGVFEPVARVTLHLTDENGLGTCFGAALFRSPLHCRLISSI